MATDTGEYDVVIFKRTLLVMMKPSSMGPVEDRLPSSKNGTMYSHSEALGL